MDTYIIKKLSCHRPSLSFTRYIYYQCAEACWPCICKLPLLKVSPFKKSCFQLRFLYGKSAEKSKDDDQLSEGQKKITMLHTTVDRPIEESDGIRKQKFDVQEKLKEQPIIYYASTRTVFAPERNFSQNWSQIFPANITDIIVREKNNLSSRSTEKLDPSYEEKTVEKTTRSWANPEDIKLTTLQWMPQKINVQFLPQYYASLAKSRLTGLVVLTAVAGYIVAPAPFDPGTFCLCSLGTALVSSSANAINQTMEVPFDSQMLRTKNRVLVKGYLTPLHAVLFGISCGCSGIGIFYFGVNEVATALGCLNLFLYTCVYTPMKRLSIANTWIGSIVGAIPPVIGWTGCTGSFDAGALILGGILFAWQFPHFNALSWNLRQDYSKAGYRMMSVINPDLCRRTALSYSAVILMLSTLAPVLNVTTWTFAADSLPFNLYFIYLAWKFYKEADSKSSRKLFRFSLLHLPALLLLMIISRKTKSTVEDTKKSL